MNPFVADFIGLANFAPARLVELKGGQGIAELTTGKGLRFPCRVPLAQRGGTVEGEGLLSVRPEDIELVPEAELTGVVVRRTFLGDRLDFRVEAEGMEWRVETNLDVQFDERARVGLLVKRAVFLAGEENHEPAAS